MSETTRHGHDVERGDETGADEVNSAEASEEARADLDDVERGDASGATAVNSTESAHPEDARAVEQERSDGPEGRGLER